MYDAQVHAQKFVVSGRTLQFKQRRPVLFLTFGLALYVNGCNSGVIGIATAQAKLVLMLGLTNSAEYQISSS